MYESSDHELPHYIRARLVHPAPLHSNLESAHTVAKKTIKVQPVMVHKPRALTVTQKVAPVVAPRVEAAHKTALENVVVKPRTPIISVPHVSLSDAEIAHFVSF